MVRLLRHRALGGGLVAVSLAACGTLGTGPVVDAPAASAPSYRTLQASPDVDDGVLGHFPFLATIRLTAAQTARLTALINRLTASGTEAEGQAAAAKFQAALLAPEVNTATLTALLTAGETRHRALAAEGAKTLAAVRAELTAAQLKVAEDNVLKAPSLAVSPPPADQTSDLTAAQQALFEAAAPVPPSAAAASKALAAFLRTGDVAAYLAVMGPRRSVSAQVALTVKALASLTLAQRQAMFQQPPGETD
jgi:hypothetical protein